MPLSDDDRQLLKEEVSKLIQEHRDTLSSVKEARNEMKTESAERLVIHQKLVQELEIYKWVIRSLFVILLGGTIYGVFNFVNFVDDRIADRVKKSDKLTQALSFAQLGQWGPALREFDVAFSNYKLATPFSDREYLDYLYSKLIWILSQHDARENLNTWVGESEWNALNGDPDFHKWFMTNNEWKHDEAVQTYLAFCTLKFDRTTNAIENARSYFEGALNATKFRQSNELRIDTAPHLLQLAMIDLLIEGNQLQAQKEINDAAQTDPGLLTRDVNSVEKTTEFEFWNLAAKRVGVNDFRYRLRNLYEAAKQARKTEPASTPELSSAG